MARYSVSLRCTHPEDIATGAVFAPGETAKGVDPKNPFDKAKIEAGVLVEIPSRKSKSSDTPEEES